MNQDLWGDQVILHQRKPQQPKRKATPRILVDNRCLYFGHSWEVIGMSGEKQCSVCGIKGYCPGCTPTPPQDAQPFYCTRHTLRESGV